MPRQINPEQKKRFITLKFFGTTNDPQDDVNPYDSVNEFLSNSVGTLNWGSSANARRNSKLRFAYTFHNVLSLYRVFVRPDAVMETISDDAIILNDAIDKIVEYSSFPTV